MFELHPLPYAIDALEPVISEDTMRLHHGRHHARYVAVANSLLADAGGAARPLEEVVVSVRRRAARALFNNAAQAWNHGFFWQSMTPDYAPPAGALGEAVARQFGGVERLGEVFVGEGAAHFGSGWVWLVAQGEVLSVVSTHDADSPLTTAARPILACDLWEHAYYLDHRNDRVGFLRAWWDKLANWRFAEEQYRAPAGGGWRYPQPSPAALA